MTTITLPPLRKHDHPEPQTHVWTALEMSAIRARDLEVARAVREACKAAVLANSLKEKPDNGEDEAYMIAIQHCAEAIRALQIEVNDADR